MNAVTLAEFRAFLREVQDNALDPVLQMALESAHGEVEAFIGFPLLEFAGGVPATIRQCICTLAMLSTEGDMSAEREAQVRGRVEAVLRPYRREAGVRAA